MDKPTNESDSDIDFSTYSQENLTYSLRRINREKYLANYEACKREIDARKAAGKWDEKDPSEVSVEREETFQWPSSEFPLVLLGSHIAIYFLACLFFRISPLSPSAQDLLTIGGMSRWTVNQYEVWRIFTSIFAHGNLMHLFGNMIGLWSLSRILSLQLERSHILLIYVVSALAGNVASLTMMPAFVVAVGASGGVFGLGGLLLSQMSSTGFPTNKALHIHRWSIIGSLGHSLVLGFQNPIVNNTAHVVGLVIGYGIGLVFLTKWPIKKTLIPALGVIAFSLFPIGFYLSTTVSAKDRIPVTQEVVSFRMGVEKFSKILAQTKKLKKTGREKRTAWMLDIRPELEQVMEEVRAIPLAGEYLKVSEIWLEVSALSMQIIDIAFDKPNDFVLQAEIKKKLLDAADRLAAATKDVGW